jgi:hypothetical protein
MWLIVFLYFIIRFLLDLNFDFFKFHNLEFFSDLFCTTLCTSAYIAFERFSFNVSFLHLPSMYMVHIHKISFLALINPSAPCLGRNQYAFLNILFHMYFTPRIQHSISYICGINLI